LITYCTGNHNSNKDGGKKWGVPEVGGGGVQISGKVVGGYAIELRGLNIGVLGTSGKCGGNTGGKIAWQKTWAQLSNQIKILYGDKPHLAR